MTDEFVEEIYAIRKQMMDECGGDFDKLLELIKRSQKEDPAGLVSAVPETEPESTSVDK
jgi:hypothetical protein